MFATFLLLLFVCFSVRVHPAEAFLGDLVKNVATGAITGGLSSLAAQQGGNFNVSFPQQQQQAAVAPPVQQSAGN